MILAICLFYLLHQSLFLILAVFSQGSIMANIISILSLCINHDYCGRLFVLREGSTLSWSHISGIKISKSFSEIVSLIIGGFIICLHKQTS